MLNQEYVTRSLGALLAIMLFSLPVMMATVAHAASTIFVLVLLLGLVFGWSEWKVLANWEKNFLYLCLAFFAVCLLSFISAEDIDNAMRRLERVFRFAAFIPLYLFVRKYSRDAIKYVQWGALTAAPIILWVAFQDAPARASGAYNPILFGDYAMLVAVVLLTVMLSTKYKWLSLAALVGVFCASYASMLSGTRGSWCVLPIAVLIALWHYTYSGEGRKQRVKRLVVSALLLITSIVGLSGSDVVSGRYHQTYQDVVSYLDGSKKNSSVGQRFMMWENSFSIWKDNPVLGTGLGDFRVDNKRMIEANETDLRAAYGEAHSLFFEFLATTGVIGFMLMMLVVIIIPCRLFVLSYASLSTDKKAKIAMGGLMLVVAFAVFGIGQNWLARSSSTSVYLVFLAVWLSALAKERLSYGR